MALVHKFDKLVPKFANLVPEKKWRAIKPETAKEGEEDLQQKLLWLLIRVPAQLNVTNFFSSCVELHPRGLSEGHLEHEGQLEPEGLR